jgi:hypothetical protein
MIKDEEINICYLLLASYPRKNAMQQHVVKDFELLLEVG